MKVTQISVTVSRTVQPVQYEPVHVSITETATVEEGEDTAKVKRLLYKSIAPKVTDFINNQIEVANNHDE